MVVFCDQEHWDSLHTSHRPFEWYSLQYRHINKWFNKLVPDVKASMLHVGVGTSRIQDGMASDGYLDILNVDYSPSVIQIQVKHCKTSCVANNNECTAGNKCSTCTSNRYQVDDATSLTLHPATFDVVLDKGTCDGMAASPRPEDCERLVSEAYRVLQPGGTFLMISFGSPYLRGPLLLDTPGVAWDSVKVWTITRSLKRDISSQPNKNFERQPNENHIQASIQRVEHVSGESISSERAHDVKCALERDSSSLQFDFSDPIQLTYEMLEDADLMNRFPMNGRTLYAYACYKAR